MHSQLSRSKQHHSSLPVETTDLTKADIDDGQDPCELVLEHNEDSIQFEPLEDKQIFVTPGGGVIFKEDATTIKQKVRDATHQEIKLGAGKGKFPGDPGNNLIEIRHEESIYRFVRFEKLLKASLNLVHGYKKVKHENEQLKKQITRLHEEKQSSDLAHNTDSLSFAKEIAELRRENALLKKPVEMQKLSAQVVEYLHKITILEREYREKNRAIETLEQELRKITLKNTILQAELDRRLELERQENARKLEAERQARIARYEAISGKKPFSASSVSRASLSSSKVDASIDPEIQRLVDEKMRRFGLL